MKTIIAGSREYGKWPSTDMRVLKWIIAESKFDITEVFCGMARGVDTLGDLWALRNSIPVKYFKADWDTFGKSAGYLRNAEMSNHADALIAWWDGESKGTKHMIDLATKKGLKVFVWTGFKELHDNP